MTNLDSILKSRDITLPTKVHLVKAIVFPVVTYGCEIWTVKKAECRRIDAFETNIKVILPLNNIRKNCIKQRLLYHNCWCHYHLPPDIKVLIKHW